MNQQTILLALSTLFLGLAGAWSQQLGNLPPLQVQTTGLQALELTPIPPDPPALIGWLGDPRERGISRISDAKMIGTGQSIVEWHSNGTFQHRLGIWDRVEGKLRYSLRGFLNLSPAWNTSPDGRYIIGSAVGPMHKPRRFGLYEFAGGKPIWARAVDHPAILLSAAFSHDSRFVAVLWRVGNVLQLDLLETLTGKVAHAVPLRPKDPYDGGTYALGSLAFGRESLFLSPGLDAQSQLMEFNLKNGSVRYYDTIVDGQDNGPWPAKTRLTLSADERWMAIYENAQVTLMEKKAGGWKGKLTGNADFVNWLGGDGFKTVSFSPDSRQLLISGNNKFRVIDPGSGKTLKEDATTCCCGLFHPGGRAFLKTCSPFEVYDPTSWKLFPNGAPEGPTGKIVAIEVSRDGRTAVVTSETSAAIWEIPDNGPGKLKATLAFKPTDLYLLSRVGWMPDSNEYQAGNGKDFFRWELNPHAAPNERQFATLAFPGRTRDDFAAFTTIIADNAGKNALYYAFGGPMVYRSLSPAQAGKTARQLDLSKVGDPANTKFVFLPGDHEFFYESLNGVNRYDITTETIRKVARPAQGTIVGYDASRNLLVTLEFDRLSGFDGDTMERRWRMFLNKDRQGPNVKNDQEAALSPDGRYVCVQLLGTDGAPGGILIADITTQKIVAVESIYGDPGDCCSFTPDGRKLIVGSSGGAASVWDVAKLLTTSPPKTEVAATTPDKPEGAAKVARKQFNWGLTPTGAISLPDGNLVTGNWTIDGIPATVVERSSMPADGSPANGATVVFADAGTKPFLRIQRSIVPHRFSGLHWSDQLENLTPETRTVIVEIDAGFAQDWRKLTVGSREPLKKNGDVLHLPAYEGSIVSMVDEGLDKRLTSFAAFATAVEDPKFYRDPGLAPNLVLRPPVEPELRWDEASKRVLCHYQLTFRPYERKRFYHSATTVLVPPDGDLPASMRSVCERGVSYTDYQRSPDVALNALNIATPWDTHPKTKFERLHERQRPFRDPTGFQWYFDQAPGEVSNDLMIERAFTLHVQGWPTSPLSKAGHPGFQVKLGDASRTIEIEKDFDYLPSGLFRLHLHVRSTQPQPITPEIKLILLLKKPATKVFSSNGKVWPVEMGDLPIELMGSQIAFTPDEPDQPSAILAIGDPAAKVRPRIHAVDAKTFEIIYTPTLQGTENLTISHYTAQLPIAAFQSTEDAMRSLPIDEAESKWEEESGIQSDNWRP